MQRRTCLTISALLLLPLAGCMVQSRKGANGDDVNISTPLGGMSVKTDNASVQSKLGLPLYPGAVLEKKKGDDNGSADVNMNFGAFHLRVLAMGFTSPDSPQKVSDFLSQSTFRVQRCDRLPEQAAGGNAGKDRARPDLLRQQQGAC